MKKNSRIPKKQTRTEEPAFVRIPGAEHAGEIPSWLPMADEKNHRNFLDGNPLAGLRALKTNMDHGYYPSTWVLGWLYDVFSKYEKGKGSLSLEELFGFRGSGQGASTIFETKETDGQNAWIALMVASLCGLGKKRGEAIKLVAEKRFLDAGTVRNIFYMMNKKNPSRIKELEENARNHPDLINEEPFKQFLK